MPIFPPLRMPMIITIKNWLVLHKNSIVTTFWKVKLDYISGEVTRQILDSGAKVIVVDSILEPLAAATCQMLQQEGHQMTVVVNGPSKHGHPNLHEIFATSEMAEPEDVRFFF